MKKVLVESPYAADTEAGLIGHVVYAQRCLTDCLERGEAPFASHLLYPQVLDDDVEKERMLGIEAGLVWGKCAEKTVVYVDKGISPGMQLGIDRARQEGRTVEYRMLDSEVPADA